MVFAVLCAALIGVFELLSLRQYLAFRQYTNLTVPALQEAMRLDPWNADYPHMLGRLYLYQEQDFAAARTALSGATALNPRDGRSWLDLAGVEQVAGNEGAEKADLERAQKAEPTMPDVAWEIGNLDLLRGDLPLALQSFATVERYSPQLRKRAVQVSWRVKPDVDLLLRYVPHTVDALSAFLNVMYEQQQVSQAAEVWQALIALKQPIAKEYVLAYLEALLSRKNRQIEQAQQVWNDYLTTNPEMTQYAERDNLVVNAGFERDVLNGGFDWRHAERPHVTLAQETGVSNSGSRSLSVSFGGSDIQDFGVYQYVAVKPNTQYQLQAYIRADNIVGSSGPRLAVIDPYDASQHFYLSDDILGTSLWSARGGDFTTGPETQIVAVALVRNPPYDPIKGHLWLDDVSIAEKGSQQ